MKITFCVSAIALIFLNNSFKRNPDGQGFAAFGKIVKGMDVVKRIHPMVATNQYLENPLLILKITGAGK